MVLMQIIECCDDDVVLLDEHLPSASATSYHAQRYARQIDGTSTFLVVWLGDRPVATGEVRWNGCAAPEVRAILADCPEINGLHVMDSQQSQGIGTALIRHAESLAIARAAPMIGLGVDDRGNPRAAALYARLGYQPTIRYLDRYSYTDDAGVHHPVEDPCIFLAKNLAPPTYPE